MHSIKHCYKLKNITFKNTKISFTDTGKGTTVVLLHGFLENNSMWNHYVAVLSKKNRVVAIDLLGHGETESLGYIHTAEANAEIVSEILSSLQIRKAVFVGHSMGGYVALAFAELYPEKTKGLVLLNSTAKEDSPERIINRSRAIKVVKQNMESFVSMAIVNLFSEDNRDKFAAEIELIKHQALKTSQQGAIASLEGMKMRKNREFILHEATFPMLLILGKKDPVLQYGETIQQIENSAVQLVTFPDGHMSFIENQAELTEVLLNFLKNT